MGYTQVGLEDKILEMYPEITKKGFAPMLSFDESKNAWIIKLKKGTQEFTTCLSKEDADACLDMKYCESFGTEIRKFLKEFKESK